MISKNIDDAQLKAAVELVSKRYAEGVDVVTAAFEVAGEYGVSPQEILSHMGQRGGNVAARNRRHARPRTRSKSGPTREDAVQRSDAREEEE